MLRKAFIWQTASSHEKDMILFSGFKIGRCVWTLWTKGFLSHTSLFLTILTFNKIMYILSSPEQLHSFCTSLMSFIAGLHSLLFIGVIHKPIGQFRVRDHFFDISNNPYLIKLTIKGEATWRSVKNTQNFGHMVYGWPHTKKV